MEHDFVLADECQPIIEAEGITIFVDPEGVDRAVFRIDDNQDPIPGCDPSEYGYALLMVNFIDSHEGVAICEVLHVQQLVDYGRDFSAEVVRNL
ncbi:hypothetical protein ACU4IU_19090 [Brevibacterium sp. CSND-B09]|uniref:hypothetical protein n=1 Tax=Brevibacterium sp. CSND-B09 TaxID=3462571 RepID=UPI00406AAE90